MVCTHRASERDLNGACARATAACSALPLLLGKERDAALHPGLVSPLVPASVIKARHSSCVATTSIRSSCLLPVGAVVFHAEAGFTCPCLGGYQLLLPNHARNLRGSKSSVREMLPSACSKHQGRWCLLYPTRHRRWALAAHGLAGVGQRATLSFSSGGTPSCKGRLALLGMLGSREATSPPQPSKMPVWLEAKVGTSVLSTEFLLKQSSFFLAINGSFAFVRPERPVQVSFASSGKKKYFVIPKWDTV